MTEESKMFYASHANLSKSAFSKIVISKLGLFVDNRSKAV